MENLEMKINKIYKQVEGKVIKMYRAIALKQRLDTFDDFKSIVLNVIYEHIDEYDEGINDNPFFFYKNYIKSALIKEIQSINGFKISDRNYKNLKIYNSFVDSFYKKNGYYPTRKEIQESNILSNAQLNHINLIKVSPLDKDEEGNDIEIIDHNDDILAKSLKEEGMRHFYIAIDNLPKGYKEIALLKLKGYKDKEIYEKLGYSRQNYSKKFNKLCLIMRDALEPYKKYISN